MKDAEITVKILEKGDKVLNILPKDNGLCIVVQKQSGEAYLYSVELDKDGSPRLKPTPDIKITFFEDGFPLVQGKAITADGKEFFTIKA